MDLRPSVKVAASDWLGARLRDFDSHVVASVVPDGFPAYVRILHPARGSNDEQVRWATVAAWSGRTMHRLAQFHAIARPLSSTHVDPAPWRDRPANGNLPTELLGALCATLADHTSTPSSCWFCLWEGYGHLGAVLPGDVLTGPRVQLPQRNYILYEGPLEVSTAVAEAFGHRAGGVSFPQSPNLLWPEDHAWCVATEIDLFCTFVAVSEAVAEALLADARLEAWRVDPGSPVVYDSDQINA